MHIGYFIDGYYPVIDGVVKIVDAYATRLSRKCKVTVFTPRVRDVEPDYYKSFPYEIVHCKSIMREVDDYPQGFPIVDPAFKARIKEAGLDIIHVHSAFLTGQCAKASSRRWNIPMVGTIHSDFRPDVRQYLGRIIGEPAIKLMMSVYNSCDECWTVNNVVGRMFCREYGLKRPFRVMPYSTEHFPISDVASARQEVNAAYGLSDSDFVMAHVGRQDLQKREDFILRSLAIFKNSVPDFKMLFVGDGNKHEYLKKLTEKLGLGDNVIFCGMLSNQLQMMKIYCRTDLLLFPSESDTFGLVKIEAACQKTPTLLCEDAMAADGITDKVNGFTSLNDEQAYADSIAKLYKDRRLLAKVGEGAFRDLYNTWDELVEDVYEKYLKVIENHNFVKQ